MASADIPFPTVRPIRELPDLIKKVKEMNVQLKAMTPPPVQNLKPMTDAELSKAVMDRALKLGYNKEALEAAMKEVKFNEPVDPSLYPEYKPGTGMMKWPRAKPAVAETPLPTELKNTKLRDLPAYFKNWKQLPTNFFLNYRAKYLATGSGTPVYQLMILAGVIGYAIEFPHLRAHKAQHKYH